ncbi:MAG: Zeta toxin family protein [Akkermansia sp.]|uniref:Zeta toxin family protein n=1 Tax=Akkermansia sp. TaxID=1872421 RepID=UPI003A164957
MDSTPQCPIVAGPNGAGKTTFALDYLMHETNCRSFINADMIAQGLSPLKPEAVQVKAGKLFLEELERHLKQRESFCFETTLSGSSYFQKIKQWKKDGWRIVLHYLWIPNAQFSALRVQEKVAQGGTWHSSGIHFAPIKACAIYSGTSPFVTRPCVTTTRI